MKALNAVDNFQEIYPRTKLYKLMDKVQRSNQSKHTGLREKPERKKSRCKREGSSVIQKKLQWWWPHMLGFLAWLIVPLSLEGGLLFIQVGIIG